MKRIVLSLGAAALLAACSGSEPAATPAPAPEAAPAAEPAKTDAAPAAAQAETSQPSADGWVSYGGDFTSIPVMPAAKLLATPADYVGKSVKVEGEVAKVCQSMGCWLAFEDGEKSITVNMKDHGFSVDKKGAGSWCEVEGTVEKVGEEFTMTASAVRMKKQDAPAEEPAEGAAPAEGEAPSKG